MKHLCFASVLAGIGICLGAACAAPAAALGELHGVTAGGGTFVAVGEDGAILSSTDALQWTNRNSGVAELLLDASFGPGQFVVVGEGGTILTSPDGSEWTKRVSVTSRTLRAAAYGGGQFVAVGDQGTVLRSLDGATWTVVAAGLTHRLNDVIYAGGMFVAVGGTSVTNGNATGFIHTSSNGVTWSQRTVVSNSELLGAGYGSGLFVALGVNATVMTSTNGITWVRRFTGLYGETARLAYGNGRFAAVMGYNSSFTSTNGVDWSGYYVPGALTLRGVAYANGRFLAVGSDQNQEQLIMLSGDGATWGNVLLPLYAPIITQQPQSVEVLAGNGWSFYVSATANPAPTYQWRFAGADLPDATESQLYFSNPTIGHAGDYSVVVGNELGSVTSLVARLLVKVSAPEFVAEPQDLETYVGGQIFLYASARGGPAPTYRWFFNGAALAGRTNESLDLTGVSTFRAGNYFAVASNLLGVVTSRVARVKVSPAVFWSQPQSQFLTSGLELRLEAGANSAVGSAFRWFFNGTNIPGANTTSLTRSSVNTNHAGIYFVVVSNIYGSVTSVVAAVGVDRMAPYIAQQPQDVAVPSGENTGFFVGAVGTPALLAQWRRNGVPIPGATGFYHGLTATTATAGNYDAVVLNFHGSVTSAVAVLTVKVSPPRFIQEPIDLAIRAGDYGYVSAEATGDPRPTYRWYRNGLVISGAVNSYYYFNGATLSQAGDYTVVASNSQGSITSRVARVAVYLVAPYFAEQPRDQTVLAGYGFSLSAFANGAPAPVYRWYLNGAALPGAAGSYLSFPNPVPAQSGTYTVIASNLAGVAFSRSATVTISNQAPAFLQEPDKQTVLWGESVGFYSSAVGGPPPRYQWLFNGVAIPGATSPNLYLSPVTPDHAGSYVVVASNIVGVTTSAVAVLTVNSQAPVFTSQPTGRTVLWGEYLSLYGFASGGPPPSFQWLLNNVPIPGATYPNLELGSVTPAQAGSYRLVASNPVGVVTSAVAVLRVNSQIPVFTQQPSSQSVLWGGSAGFYGYAAGGPPPTFQWLFNGVPIPGAVDPNLYFNYVTPSQAGSYRLVASNPVGVVTSAVAVLTVTSQAPVFTQQPSSQTVLWGDFVGLYASASGGPPPTFQWLFNGVPIPGAVNPNLYFNFATPSQSGSYRLVASNPVGVVTSAVAVLTVNSQAPVFTQQPFGQTVLWGGSASFYSFASGGPSPTYQWLFNGTPIRGRTSTDLSLYNVTPAEAGNYQLVASNAVGVTTSAVAVLTVTSEAPVFFSHPASQSLLWGGSLSLYAAASGGPPPTYQWLFNDAPISKETNNSYFVPYALPAQAGNYSVVASNVVGVTTSLVAVVTVEAQAPVFVSEPVDVTVLWGGYVYLYGVASGGPPPVLQWMFNGRPIAGATNNQFTIEYALPTQSGNYTVVASNVVGVTTSVVAVVTVEAQTPIFQSEPQDRTVLWGENFYFYVSAYGGPPPALQWLFNGGPIPRETNNYLNFQFAAPVQSGAYSVVASNAVGVTTSAVAVLTVYSQIPVFNQQPSGQSVLWGGSVSLYAYAWGGPPPVFQWLFNGAPIPFQTSSSLFLYNLIPAQSGSYSLVASNAVGVTTSSVAVVTVNSQAPIFSTQPTSRAVLWGDAVNLYATAFGGPPPTYQWLFNNAPLIGQTSPSLYFEYATPSQGGNYRVVASNAVGVTTSLVAVLTVNTQAPYFVQQPESRSVLWGEFVSLYGWAVGGPPPTLQWMFNGVPVAGATNNSLDLGSALPAQSGNYTIVASNAVGVATSLVAVVTVSSQAPYFASEPNDQTVLWGDYAQFYAYAPAGPPATYQWFFNDAPLLNETNNYLNIPYAGTNFAGLYHVVAMNQFGAVTSRVATLSIETAEPYFQQEPGDAYVLWGDDVYFYSSAIGGPKPDYQWRFNGLPIPGATNATLQLFNVSTNDNGGYDVVASNFLGAVTSRVAMLVVNVQAPEFSYHWPGDEVVEGTDVQLYAGAYGGPRPALYLLLNGLPLALPYSEDGGFLLTEVTTNDSGNYSFIASNMVGSVTSSVAVLNVLPGGPLDRWTRRNPRPQAENLLAITHGNGRFVCTGERGSVVVSTNGSNWIAQRLRADADLAGVASGNGLYVAVSRAGNILTSSNAVQWLPRVLDPTLIMEGVTFGNGRFVAVGGPQENVSLVSTNGIDWTRGVGLVSTRFKGVTWGNGLFVGVLEGQGAWPAILVSSNGLDWLAADGAIIDNLENVAFGNGQFVAVGSNGAILTSSDGWVWTRRFGGTTRRMIEVAYGNGRWVVVGVRGIILSSADGVTWRSESSGTPDRMEGITFAGGLFVAVGENGTTLTSSNGAAWTKRNLGSTRDLDGIAIGRDGLIVTVGKFGAILTTPDGTRITERASGTTNDLHGVAFANDLYVAVGDGGAVVTSGNGVAWNARTFGAANYYKNVAHGGGLWVAVGTRGVIVASPDGADWTARFSGLTRDLNDVAYGNGMFMVVGDGFPSPDGTVLTSTDGVTWVNRSFYTGKNLRSVAFANGVFLVIGNDGIIYSTSDAITWTPRDSGVYGDGRNLRNATYAAGHWIVVGNNGLILTSTNTMNWRRRAPRTVENLHGVRYVNGTFVTIGNRGTLLQSGRVIGPELRVREFLPGLGFVFAIEAEMDRDYRLQGSDDLQTWSDLLDFNNTQSTTLFLDEEAEFYPSRFYRVVSP